MLSFRAEIYCKSTTCATSKVIHRIETPLLTYLRVGKLCNFYSLFGGCILNTSPCIRDKAIPAICSSFIIFFYPLTSEQPAGKVHQDRKISTYCCTNQVVVVLPRWKYCVASPILRIPKNTPHPDPDGTGLYPLAAGWRGCVEGMQRVDGPMMARKMHKVIEPKP